MKRRVNLMALIWGKIEIGWPLKSQLLIKADSSASKGVIRCASKNLLSHQFPQLFQSLSAVKLTINLLSQGEG